MPTNTTWRPSSSRKWAAASSVRACSSVDAGPSSRSSVSRVASRQSQPTRTTSSPTSTYPPWKRSDDARACAPVACAASSTVAASCSRSKTRGVNSVVGAPSHAGTSMGAVMAAFLALDLGADERTARAKAALCDLMDLTLPLAGLVKGGRMAELAEREFGGRDLEDLWRPCLAVSTNLTRSEPAVHRRGSIVKALRASVALPGIVPPVVYGGELHVDGGVLDNLPVRQLRRASPRGPIVAVNVSPSAGPRATEDFGLSLSGWGLLARRLRPRRSSRDGGR